MKISRIHILFIFLSTTLFISSCEKDELPYVLPPKPLDSVILMQVNLGENYEDQVFINFLDSNFIRARVRNNAWDLAFDCAPESYRIFINGGKGVFLGVVGKDNFLSAVDVNKVQWRWDASSGGDSIVLSRWCNLQNWKSYDSVYVIDRGPETEIGKRYYQFRLMYDGPGKVKIIAATLSGVPAFTTTVQKDPGKNQKYVDFGSGQVLNFEPPSFDWQFCFLRTRWVYYEFTPPLVYTVTGIHINPKIVSVAMDSNLHFEGISRKEAESFVYSSKRDALGFEWKVYDFIQGKYITRKHVNYIFRMRFGLMEPYRYYKLRFTDYYSRQGVKGSPRFEVAEIK